MPIDVRMPDGTLVKNVPDNITQADLAARFDAFKAQVGTPVDSVTPQAPVTGPEGAPIPSILQTQTQPKEEMSASKAAKDTVEEVGGIARRLIADPALGLAKGVINAEEFLVGLGDILTGGRAGKIQEETMKERGMPSPQQMKDFLTSLQSPERIESVKKVAEAKGFGPTALSLIENPAALSEIVESSLPSMAASQVGLGRYLLPKVAPKMGAVSRGAVGEATVQAGSMAEQVRQQNEDRLLTPEQSAISVVSGILTGAQGLLGGKVAQKLGLQDVDTLLAGGVSNDVKRNILTTAFKSALAESAFEEMPQSVQEQISQNIALGRPPLEGVAEAGAAGALAGFATAGGITGVSQFQQNRRLAKAAQPTPPPVSERIEPEVTPREPVVEVGQPTIVPSPEIEAYDKEIAKAQPTETKVSETSHDTQAMMDELSGKSVKYIPEEEDKVAESPKTTPKGELPVGSKVSWNDDGNQVESTILDSMSKAGITMYKVTSTDASKPNGVWVESSNLQPIGTPKGEVKPEVLYSVPMGENTEYHVLKNDLGHVANLYDKDAGRYVADSARIFPVENFGAQTEAAAKNFVDEEQNKAAAYEPSIKEEPTGVITEEEKEFTPVGGRLISKADADKLARESAIALEQNLKNQEIQRDKQLRREIREDKFPAAETPSLASALKALGGINQSNKLDMLKDTGKVFNYESAFSKDGEDLLTYIENGDLDEYLPHQLRLSNTPPNEAFDPRPAYDYISSVIESKQKVHDYDYELAKIDHKNKIREKYLAKQYMEPNEAAQAAAAEVQGKEYMNIKPDEIVPPLGKAPEVGTMEWLTEDNPPVHNLYEGNKSLKVEMNKLVRDIESGRASDEEVKDAVLNIYETTKKPKVDQPLVRGPEHIKRRLLEAKLNGTLSPKAVDMAEWLINKNPEIMRESAISIKEEPKGNKKAGEYVPEKRLIQLFNHIGDEKTPVHESLHSVERLLPEDIRSGIRKAWLNNLFKEYNSVSKGKDENLKQYFKGIVDYHLGENPIGDVVAKDLIQKGLVDKSNYQFFNPSEFWAIRGSDIVADRFNAEISKSTVNRLRQWIKEFIQKLKSTFGLNSNAPIIRALDSLAKSDGKFKTNDMLAESAEYASIGQPPKNIKGQEVIPKWNAPEESKVDDWLYRLQDKHIDAKRVQQIIEKAGKKIEDNWNFYEKEQLFHGRTASGIRKFLLQEVLPAAKEMQRLNITPEEIHNYLLNRHAEERNIQMNEINPGEYDPKTNTFKPSKLKDQGSGVHTDDARRYLANLDPVKKKHLEDVAKFFDKMTKGTQGILMNSGAETGDTIRQWNKTYKHYVPLMRKEDASSKTQGMIGTGQGYASRGDVSKRALGSLKEHQDILGNIIAQRERSIIRAEKIRVGRALYGLAIQNPNPEFWLPVNPDAIRNKKQAVAELTRLGITNADFVVNNLMAEPKERYLKQIKQTEGTEPNADFDFDSGLPVNQSKEVVASKVNVMARYKDNVFPVRIDGKDRFIFFNMNDPRAMRMVQAIKNLDVEELGLIESIAGRYTLWFKNVNTQYNPVFGLKNFIRDYSAGNLNLTSTPINGMQAQITADMMPAMRGIMEVIRNERKGIATANTKWGKFFKLMRDQGFQTGYRDSLVRNQEEMQIVNNILEGLNKKGVKANVKKAFSYIAGGLTDFNDVMENSIRLATAKAALDRGLSPQQAAIIAKNITVNFDKKGAKTRQIGALYAFFNPAVQGTERIYQTLKGPAKNYIIGGGILAGMIQAVMMAMAGYDDEDPPEFTRQKAFVIPMPDGHYLPIPYPQGYNILPNVGRITMDFIINGGKNPGKHVANLTGAIMDSLSPLGTIGWSMQSIAPTALDPFAALAENKDAFGRPIARKDRETSPTPGYSRSRDTASTLSKGIAEFLNSASFGDKYVKGSISPTGDQLDFLAGQVGGGLYREASKAVEYAKSKITGEEVPAYRVPIVGQFHGEVSQPAAIANKFYQNVTRMADHENTIKGLKEDKLPKDQYMAKYPEAKLWHEANTTENRINQINKQKREDIKKNKPKEVIQRHDDKKTRIMKEFNDKVKRLTPD